MKRFRYIVVCILYSVLCIPADAAKPQPAELTTEQQQQFTYYWYAAKQAIEEERYADALVTLQLCEQINPNDGATQEFLGVMYDALGQKERALQSYARAFRNDPHDRWLRYSVALLSQQTEETQHEAMRVLEKAHSVNPTDEDLLQQLRKVYVSERQYKKALRIQDEIDAMRGYDVYSAYNRTQAYALWDKPKKAIAEVNRWLENEPTNTQFMLYRIELMERTGAKPQALYEAYEQVLRVDPRNLMVLNNYAYLLATRGGDLRKAEQMSQITIREEPENPVYLDTYGWILYLQGQKQLALFYLRKALANATDSSRAEIEAHLRRMER